MVASRVTSRALAGDELAGRKLLEGDAADCPLPLLADLIPVAASDVVPSFDRRDAPGRGESEKAVKQGLASAA